MPKARTWTAEEPDGTKTTYQGFDRDFSGPDLEHVVLVITEGELDVYAVMSPKGPLGDLLRYLVDRGENSQLLGIYSRK